MTKRYSMELPAGDYVPYDDYQRLKDVISDILYWAERRCPCHNEEPNPCPLCGASIENLEGCKSAENTLPRDLLYKIREAKRL